MPIFESREIVIDGKTWIMPEYRYLDTTPEVLRDFGVLWKIHDGRWVSKKIDDCPFTDHTRLVLWRSGVRDFKDKEVHHIDEDPLNDSLDNLELLTRSEHKKRHSVKESCKFLHLPSGKIYRNLHHAKLESGYSGHYLNCCYYPRKSSKEKFNNFYVDFRKIIKGETK